MNVEILEKVKAEIRAHPERLDIDIVVDTYKGCGCIAGLWVLISGADIDIGYVSSDEDPDIQDEFTFISSPDEDEFYG